MTTIRQRAAVVLLAVLLTSCGQSGTAPTPTVGFCSYTAWTPAVCPASGRQTRTVNTASPSGCTAPSNPVLEQSCTPVQLTLTVNTFIQTDGPRGSFTRTVTAGDNVTIRVADLGLPDADPDRIVVRDAAAGGVVGALVGFSRQGSVTLSGVSATKSYDVIAMKAGFPYNLIDAQTDANPLKGKLSSSFPREMLIYQVDAGASGPESYVQDVISRYDAAVNRPGLKMGSFTKVAGSSGTINMQYRHPIVYLGQNICGERATYPGPLYVISIHSDRCAAISRNILGLMVQALFEILTGVVDIDGGGSSVNGPDDASITERGRAFLTYVYIKDSKGW